MPGLEVLCVFVFATVEEELLVLVCVLCVFVFFTVEKELMVTESWSWDGPRSAQTCSGGHLSVIF